MRIPGWARGTVLLAVTLAAGFGLGVTYERGRPAAHDARGMGAHDVMHHFTRVLDLDSAQQAAISQILASHQPEVDSSWHTVQPHVRATLDSTRREVASVLRPDQLEKFRKMMETAHPASHR